jgi:hypothetical protein
MSCSESTRWGRHAEARDQPRGTNGPHGRHVEPQPEEELNGRKGLVGHAFLL